MLRKVVLPHHILASIILRVLFARSANKFLICFAGARSTKTKCLVEFKNSQLVFEIVLKIGFVLSYHVLSYLILRVLFARSAKKNLNLLSKPAQRKERF